MPKIELVNENGMLIGRDPETGERVPIEFGDILTNTHETGSIDVERASIGPESRAWGDRIDLFAVGGQSNALGGGDQAASPDLTADTAVEYSPSTDAIESPLDDPVGDGQGPDSGSAWPAFAEQYHRITGQKLAIVVSAVGGSAMNAKADNGSGSWDANGTRRDDLVSDISSAVTKLAAEGYDVQFRGVLWSQGERDARAIDNGKLTKLDYKSTFEKTIDFFEDEFGDDFRLYCAQTAHFAGGDTPGFQAVRDAQEEVCLDKSTAVFASGIQQNFPNAGHLADRLHYDQTGLDAMGRQLANGVVGERNPPNCVTSAELTNDGESIPAAEPTPVPLDAARLGAEVATLDTPHNRIVIDQGGTYVVMARITVESPAGETRVIGALQHNGSTVDRADTLTSDRSDNASVGVWGAVDADAGDKLRIVVSQDSGEEVTVASGSDRTRLDVVQIAQR